MRFVKITLLDGPRAGESILADPAMNVLTLTDTKRSWRDVSKPVPLVAYRVMILQGIHEVGSTEPPPIYHVAMANPQDCPVQALIAGFRPQQKERH